MLPSTVEDLKHLYDLKRGRLSLERTEYGIRLKGAFWS